MVLDDVGRISGIGCPARIPGLGAAVEHGNSRSRTQSASVEIVNSSTSGGGNIYVSGFDSALVDGNTFDGQGIALNGVTNDTVTGNIFQNIDNTVLPAQRHRTIAAS